MAEREVENKKLSDVFDEVWKLYEFLERCDEPTVSEKVQSDVAKALTLGEEAVRMINVLHLFSDNENIQEVSTEGIRYLLMPALLAYFTSKSTKGDRFELIKKAQVYHVDYLRLIKLYSIQDIEVPNLNKSSEDAKNGEQKPQAKPGRPGVPDLARMERQRKAKVERYRQQKATEARLLELSKAVKVEHVDEEVKRDYYMKLLGSFVAKAQDELESIEMEIPMLEHMAKLKAGGENGLTADAKAAAAQPKKKFQPFILTKDKLQAAVYGAGYPSLPTYSVEEFFDMEAAAGRLPDQGPTQLHGGSEAAQVEASKIEKEEAQERDDPEALEKARQWDDWKDNHRRGWGNRQNMG